MFLCKNAIISDNMSEVLLETPFTPGYIDELERQYEPKITRQITDAANWKQVETPGNPDSAINYVDVRPVEPLEGVAPIYLQPGFGGGVINKASTIAELASRGYRVVSRNQDRTNRRAFMKENGLSAIQLQALDALAVMEDSGVIHEKPTVIAQSLGALMLDAAEKMRLPGSHSDEVSPFAESSFFMIAAAGGNKDETASDLTRRWLRFLWSQRNSDGQDFPDVGGLTGKASLKVLTANPRLTIREALGELPYTMLDPTTPERVGQYVLMSFGQNEMYPNEKHYKHAEELVRHGATWSMPYDSTVRKGQNGEPEQARGIIRAVHDDDQYNPSRVVGAIQKHLDHPYIRQTA